MEQADCPYQYRFDDWKKCGQNLPSLSVKSSKRKRKIVSEIQQTEIEKLADSFKLARFTLADSFKNPWNP